jgi:hypothetical protein
MFWLQASGAAARRRPQPTSWSSDPVAAVAELIRSPSRLHRAVQFIEYAHFTLHQIPCNPLRRSELARFSTPNSPTPVAAVPRPGKSREHGLPSTSPALDAHGSRSRALVRRRRPRRPWYSPTHSRVSTPSAARTVAVAPPHSKAATASAACCSSKLRWYAFIF